MTGLNDNYKRRIQTSLQYADKLLEENLHALSPAARSLFSGYVQDLSPSESRCVESYTYKIREQMARLLERSGIELSAQTIPSSGKIRTGLTSADLTLEDISPEKMRGYGKMDASAARDLSWSLHETRRLIGLLLAYLSDARAARTEDRGSAEIDPPLAISMQNMARIIAEHGLVEFLPALQAIGREAGLPRCSIALFGAGDSGKASLLNRLISAELMPVGATSSTAFPVRIVPASRTRLRVTFLDRVEDHDVSQLASYATEEGNPENSKRVVAIEVSAPPTAGREEIAFLAMPDGGYAGIGASEFARAFLPEIDLGLILIDGRSRISDSDLDLLAALESAKIASAALISRCDLLTAADTDRIVSATRDLAAKRLGWTPEVIPVSANASWVPRVSSWVEGKLAPQLREARAARLESTARAVQGLRASLTAALEMKLNHTGKRQDHSQEAEEIFQRMDECLHAFQQHWEKEFDKIAGWTGEILEEVAASLATAASPTDSSGGISSDMVSQTLVATLAARFRPFLAEYQDFTPRVNADIHILKSVGPSAILLEQALPAISSLPTPMRSQLTAVALPGTLARAGHAARIRHFRKELEDKAATRFRRTLEELQPRLRRWLLATMNTLRENMRMQTDPLRYYSASLAPGKNEGDVRADIASLRIDARPAADD